MKASDPELSSNGNRSRKRLVKDGLNEPGQTANSKELALSLGAALFCIILVAIDLRPGIVSIGPILPGIRDEFHLSHTAASLLTAIPDFIMGLLALPTPWLAKKYGRDRVILAALVLLFLATAARAFSPSTLVLLLTTAGVGAGIAIAGALIAGFVKASFPSKAAFMMGIYGTALSLGSTISAGVTGPVAASVGWRVGAGMWSLLGIVAIGSWVFIEYHERRSGIAKRAAKHFSLPLRNPTAWLVALFFACDNFLFYAYLSWTAPMFREHGFSATGASLILATYTFAFMVANPIFGALSKSEDRRMLLAASAVITLAGIVPMALDPDRLPFLWVSLVAFGLGGGFTLGMTLPLDNTHEPEEANVWNAFVLTVGYLIAAAGPLLVGALRDTTGSFEIPLWLLVVVGALMLVLTPFLRPHHHKARRADRVQ